MLAPVHGPVALLGCEVNGGADTLICPAAAHVAGHRLIDVVVSWLRSFGQQCRGRHDLARLTVAALHDVELEPCLLKSLSNRRLSNRFDRGDGFLTDGTDGRYARAHRHAVDVHGAGAAQGDAAAELCTRDAEHIAQHPQQRSVSIDVDCPRSAVDVERECHVRASSITSAKAADTLTILRLSVSMHRSWINWTNVSGIRWYQVLGTNRHHRPIVLRSGSWSNADRLARMLARRDHETDAVILAIDTDRCVRCGRNAVRCANGRRAQDTRRFQALVPGTLHAHNKRRQQVWSVPGRSPHLRECDWVRPFEARRPDALPGRHHVR